MATKPEDLIRKVLAIFEAGGSFNSAQERLIHETRIALGDLPEGACLHHGLMTDRVETGGVQPDTFVCSECGKPVEAP